MVCALSEAGRRIFESGLGVVIKGATMLQDQGFRALREVLQSSPVKVLILQDFRTHGDFVPLLKELFFSHVVSRIHKPWQSPSKNEKLAGKSLRLALNSISATPILLTFLFGLATSATAWFCQVVLLPVYSVFEVSRVTK